MTHNKDMINGHPLKLILSFAVPLLIGNFFQQLYNVVDTFVVGKYVGLEALAGVGASGSSIFIVQGFIIGMTNGFSVPIAHSYGAGNYDKMRKYAAAQIVLCSAITVFFSILMQFLLKPVLILMKTPEDVLPISYEYAQIIYMGIICTIAYNVLAGMLRALGNSIIPLYFLIISSLLNIILSVLFTGHLGMGVKGVALSTVLSQLISVLLCYLYIRKKQPLLRLTKEDFRISRGDVFTLLKIGIPIGLQASVTSLGAMFLQTAINSLGTLYIAAFSTANKVENMIATMIPAIGSTLTTFTGQNLGAGKIDRVKSGVRYTVIIMAVIAVIGILILLPFGRTFASQFIKGEQKAEVINYAYFYIVILTLFLFPLGLLSVFRSVLLGMKHGFAPMMSGICELIVRCLVALIFVKIFRFTAVCLAGPLAWILALIPLFITYQYRIRKLIPKNSE